MTCYWSGLAILNYIHGAIYQSEYSQMEPSNSIRISRRQLPLAIGKSSFLLLCAVASLLSGACASLEASRAGAVFSDCDACPKMVVIPAGSFQMGSEKGEQGRPEGPVHDVSIQRQFALARTETTLAEFRHFIDATGYSAERNCRTFVEEQWQNSSAHDWMNPGPGVAYSDDGPVVCVSWRDAVAYTNWLSEVSGHRYRLPSEAEWEYAASAGSDADYFWGANAADGCRFANMYDESSARSITFSWAAVTCEDGWETLAPVASLAANDFGLHDMLGNVWEWTADCYVAPYQERVDPQTAYLDADAACDRRTVRGGSWMTRPSRQRLAFRGRDPEDARMSYFGFRVARELPN